MRLLAAEHRNVMVVGDGDQSSTGSAAPTSATSCEFEEAFPDATVIVLEQNYRSTQTHPRRRQRGDRQQRGAPAQEALDRAGGGELIIRYQAEDERDEAAFVAREIPRSATRGRPVGRRRGLLPDQRAEPGVEETLVRAGHAVPGRRRARVLRPARGEGRPRLPAGARQPRRRGELSSGSQHARSAGSATRRSTRSPRTPGHAASRSSTRSAGPTTPASPEGARRHPRLPRAAGRLPSGAGRAASAPSRPCSSRTGYVAELEAERSIEAEGRHREPGRARRRRREFDEALDARRRWRACPASPASAPPTTPTGGDAAIPVGLARVAGVPRGGLPRDRPRRPAEDDDQSRSR